MPHPTLTSPRLRWQPLTEDALGAFHALAVDPHVRQYLMDGHEMSPEWCAEAHKASDALFEAQGLGLWLLHAADTDAAPIGFAGFHVFPEMGSAPQLIYAFVERVTGSGLATEAARALVFAATETGLDPVTAAVDGPNAASMRVLEKLGFGRVETRAEGAFGETVFFSRRAAVELRALDRSNYLRVMDLKVRDDQKHFVATNAESMAQAHFNPHAWMRGIFADDTPVGFLMLSVKPEAAEYGLWRLMVAADRQGHGYGRAGMTALIEHVRGLPGATSLMTSYVPGEGCPAPFYRGLGFVETGEKDGDEVVMALAL